MRYLLVVTCLAALAVPSFSRQIPQSCGSYRDKWKEEFDLSRKAAARRAKSGRPRALAPATVVRDVGNIVVIDDSDGVVTSRNPFNLNGKSVVFRPGNAAASNYRFETGANTYDDAAASAGYPLEGLGDDDSRLIPIPFAFPFFGSTYNVVYINSDGNLSFSEADHQSSERSLGRMTAGPPRISPLFDDLDPSLSTAGVRVLSENGRLVVSWAGVPEYQDAGVGAKQTFQVRLYPDGRIEFSWSDVTSLGAVVGIAPGSLKGSTSLVSFTAGSGSEFSSTVAERFGDTEEVDVILAGQKFYEQHEDAYDYIVIFNNRNIPAAAGAVAWEITVRNNRTGYGDELVNVGAQLGSPRRLQGVMNMGPLNQYPSNPNAVVKARFLSGDTPLTVIGHEAGHLFLAYASIPDPTDPKARPMLGRQLAHWSFLFNSEASLLEGNRIRDNGATAAKRFTTTATVEGYAPLDQYLMGFRPAGEVPPTFLVTDSDIGTGSRSPQTGVSFNGTRKDVTVEDIIQADGRRTPDSTVSQRNFRFAFILVTKQGTDPTPEEIAQLDTYRREFETAYAHYANDRATAETSLVRSVRLSTFPAVGVLAGSSITATVSIEKPSDTPVAFLIDSPDAFISAPNSLTIPAGQTSVGFNITGNRAGVARLAVGPASGADFETVRSQVQVLDGVAAGLRLSIFAGDKQVATAGTPMESPIIVNAADFNNLPYPGLKLRASASAGGTVTPASATTDDTGLVKFTWTPGPGDDNQLRVTIEGGPDSAAVTATAVGHPAIVQGGVVNAASGAPGLVPGSLMSVFGSGLAGGNTAQSGFPLPTLLAGSQVLVNQRAAQLLYASDRQINFLAPVDLAGDTAQLTVVTPSGLTATIQAPVAAVLPGIFFDPASGIGAAVVSGKGLTTDRFPASRGAVLEVYATGLGAVRPAQILGLMDTIARPTASIGGIDSPVLFSGLAPGFVGLYQLNVQVPAGAASGLQPLLLQAGGVKSNTVKVRIAD